jgi:hypothetical protein
MRYTKSGLVVIYEHEFEWNITYQTKEKTQEVERVTATTLPIAIDRFDRKVKSHGRIVGVRKVGAIMVEAGRSPKEINPELQKLSAALSFAPPTI